MTLRGKVSVITGGSRGIGKALALELARMGSDIVIAARTETPRRSIPGTLGETVAAIQALGRRCLAVKADLAIEADLVRLHGETLRAFGQCDILVNNAALTDRLVFAPLAEVDRAGLEKYLATNLVAPFQLMKLFAEGMKARRSGVIINITSGAANFIDPHETGRVRDEGTVYGTSKAGLNRLSNSVAWQLREHGIPVIAVDPGSTQTEVWHLVQSRSPNLAPANGHPVDWPVNVVRYLLECPDPMAYTGQVIVTENFVVEQRLA